jgi:hypothetical protein
VDPSVSDGVRVGTGHDVRRVYVGGVAETRPKNCSNRDVLLVGIRGVTLKKNYHLKVLNKV